MFPISLARMGSTCNWSSSNWSTVRTPFQTKRGATYARWCLFWKIAECQTGRSRTFSKVNRSIVNLGASEKGRRLQAKKQRGCQGLRRVLSWVTGRKCGCTTSPAVLHHLQKSRTGADGNIHVSATRATTGSPAWAIGRVCASWRACPPFSLGCDSWCSVTPQESNEKSMLWMLVRADDMVWSATYALAVSSSTGNTHVFSTISLCYNKGRFSGVYLQPRDQEKLLENIKCGLQHRPHIPDQ